MSLMETTKRWKFLKVTLKSCEVSAHIGWRFLGQFLKFQFRFRIQRKNGKLERKTHWNSNRRTLNFKSLSWKSQTTKIVLTIARWSHIARKRKRIEWQISAISCGSQQHQQFKVLDIIIIFRVSLFRHNLTKNEIFFYFISFISLSFPSLSSSISFWRRPTHGTHPSRQPRPSSSCVSCLFLIRIFSRKNRTTDEK